MKKSTTEEIPASETSAAGDGSSPEMVRREFMKRFGVYAAGSAIGLYVLMSPKTSRAVGSGPSDGAP